ncbi:MAG TPA: hypothetical protein VES67_17355 [Vicinamibacterales bacterium]|nr:hypothetical protein [Vicinamibacterales bacterium]
MQIPSTPIVLVAAAVAGVSGQQAEIDRVLWNFGGSVITTTDVWQARQLKLVPGGDTDDQILRGLQNRQLILLELRRVSPAPPAAADIATRRREWEASLGPGADVRGLLTKSAMSEKACEGWITDDLRIRAYLRERFGMLPEAERGARTDEWLRGLRQRAGLGK